MQVCRNGHVINDGYQKYPQYNKDYCDKCGVKTITTCPNCNNLIPGDIQDTGVIAVGFRRSAPEFCEHCGEKFPWSNGKEESASARENQQSLEILKRLFSKFHVVVRQLRNRYSERETLDVSDEYDVQDLLHSLLRIFFDDVRKEEWTPSYAGKSARMDFLLKERGVVIEVKMTRKGFGDKELGDQLLKDVERYKEHKDCKTLVCFIYDPDGRINNPDGLVKDLQGQSRDELDVVVFVNPS